MTTDERIRKPVAGVAPVPAAFVAVALQTSLPPPISPQDCEDVVAMDLQARLPNGKAIDLHGIELRHVGEVIEALGRLQCSASCEGLKVYLHRDPVDFRLSVNGLVEQALALDPYAPCAHVFSNRRRDRVKTLRWERNGFWLLPKRLEKDRFIWPSLEAMPDRALTRPCDS